MRTDRLTRGGLKARACAQPPSRVNLAGVRRVASVRYRRAPTGEPVTRRLPTARAGLDLPRAAGTGRAVRVRIYSSSEEYVFLRTLAFGPTL
jgi:hypothetical protein